MLRVSDTQPNAGPWKNCMGVLGGRREVREGWREGRMGGSLGWEGREVGRLLPGDMGGVESA